MEAALTLWFAELDEEAPVDTTQTSETERKQIYHWLVSVRVDSFNVEEDGLHFTTWEKKTNSNKQSSGGVYSQTDVTWLQPRLMGNH